MTTITTENKIDDMEPDYRASVSAGEELSELRWKHGIGYYNAVVAELEYMGYGYGVIVTLKEVERAVHLVEKYYSIDLQDYVKWYNISKKRGLSDKAADVIAGKVADWAITSVEPKRPAFIPTPPVVTGKTYYPNTSIQKYVPTPYTIIIGEDRFIMAWNEETNMYERTYPLEQAPLPYLKALVEKFDKDLLDRRIVTQTKNLEEEIKNFTENPQPIPTTFQEVPQG